MLDASPFSSLEDATSFASQLWFKESRITLSQVFTKSFSTLFWWYVVQVRYENTLVVELDIAARLWERLSRSQTQEASIEMGEVVPDSVEKEAVASSDSSEEADSTGQKASMLSYDLNKTPDENEYPYSGMSPDKKNAWHLAMWTTRYLNP
ncbi:hypothetical protein AHAS_Ahas20G0184900 [Arachis hypogaea]